MGNTRKVSTSQMRPMPTRTFCAFEAPARFRRTEGDWPVRRRDPAVSLQHLPAVRGRHSPAADRRHRSRRAEKLRQFAEQRQELVKSFLLAYPALCQDAAKRLRGLYNPADDPPASDVEREFGFSWQYVSFGVPDQLKGISQEVWQQEREKAAQRMAEASSEIQQVLRETMAKLVQHMAERLKVGADGKPVCFKETTVSNLVEFLANFEFRNVTDDAELQGLVNQARTLLQGVEADDLRSTGELRARVQAGMEGLASELDTMLTESGSRKFRFDEEDA